VRSKQLFVLVLEDNENGVSKNGRFSQLLGQSILNREIKLAKLITPGALFEEMHPMLS